MGFVCVRLRCLVPQSHFGERLHSQAAMYREVRLVDAPAAMNERQLCIGNTHRSHPVHGPPWLALCLKCETFMCRKSKADLEERVHSWAAMHQAQQLVGVQAAMCER